MPVPDPRRRRWPARRTRPRTASGCRGSWTRRSDGRRAKRCEASAAKKAAATKLRRRLIARPRPSCPSPGRQGGLRGRGDPGPPGPHRRRRRAGARVPARRHRGRAGRGRRGRRRARAAGEKLGPLAGVPVAVKDVMTTRGVPTTARLEDPRGLAAAVRRDDRDAACARPAWSCSARRTWTSSRWARPPSTRPTARRHNPWDLGRIPGGSGGGSAAALAAYEAPLAIGTDTGGSIRQPGAVTGTVGAKPTYGGTSRYGLIAFSSSLDTPGPCARTVEDAALLHAVIAGHDPRDSTSIPAPVPDVVGGGPARRHRRPVRRAAGPGHASSAARAPSPV